MNQISNCNAFENDLRHVGYRDGIGNKSNWRTPLETTNFWIGLNLTILNKERKTTFFHNPFEDNHEISEGWIYPHVDFCKCPYPHFGILM